MFRDWQPLGQLQRLNLLNMPSIRESDPRPAAIIAWFQAVLVMLVISVVWLGIGINLRQERAQIERDAWAEADNLARGFAESRRRTV